MYAIEKGLKRINGESVETFSRDIQENQTELRVEAGTTGYKGNNSRDAGGRSYICVMCKRGDFYFKNIQNSRGQTVGIEIACCGDEGLEALLKSLTFSRRVFCDSQPHRG